jgi:carbon monoxide dehydrogenase subunit G
MASIFKESVVRAPAAKVWDAVRDVGAVASRLAPGFVTHCELQDGARMVTFANGLTVREVIVGLDETRRRLAYSATGGRAAHHNASIQVVEEGNHTRFLWTADVLPDEVAPMIDGMMEAGLKAMTASLEAREDA